MTKEEAIKVLEAEKKFLFHGSLSDKHYEPEFDMAIEALKAQATLDDVSNAYENGYKQGKFEALQWIPCSERLPEDNKAGLGYAPKYKNIWAVYITVSGEWMIWMPGICTKYDEDFNGEIVAWMPLPSPLAKVYEQLPGIEIIHCKDCERHNVAVKDWYDDHEKKVCPLVEHRGKAQGHEFDYQFCVYGERKEQ